MRDLVIIPGYNRPEFLWLCLERIIDAYENSTVDVLVVVDNHQGVSRNLEYERVVATFKDKLHLAIKVRNAHSFRGNSFNVLTAYKDAMERDSRFIFLIEEDVMIARDFFQWSRAAHQLGNFFCTVGVRNTRRTDLPPIDDGMANLVYSSLSDYASLGVCWKKKNLEPVVKHAVFEYFDKQGIYVHQHFAGSRFKKEFCEQDGLILRIMGEEGGASAWAYKPRAYHLGWYGYNRPSGVCFVGNLDVRLKLTREIMFNKPMLNKLGPKHQDIEPIDLNGFNYGPLKFHREYG